MKNNADTLIFHTPICAEASQIEFDTTIEIASATALAVFLLRNSYATLQNGDFYDDYRPQ